MLAFSVLWILVMIHYLRGSGCHTPRHRTFIRTWINRTMVIIRRALIPFRLAQQGFNIGIIFHRCLFRQQHHIRQACNLIGIHLQPHTHVFGHVLYGERSIRIAQNRASTIICRHDDKAFLTMIKHIQCRLAIVILHLRICQLHWFYCNRSTHGFAC